MGVFHVSDAVANAMLDAIETAIGTSPILRLYTGAIPANTAAAATGTQLASITLASNWADNASGRAKALSNMPLTDSAADASGVPGYWRLWNSAGTVCGLQGDIGDAASSASMKLGTLYLTAGLAFTILSAVIRAKNAGS